MTLLVLWRRALHPLQYILVLVFLYLLPQSSLLSCVRLMFGHGSPVSDACRLCARSKFIRFMSKPHRQFTHLRCFEGMLGDSPHCTESIAMCLVAWWNCLLTTCQSLP